MRRLLIASSTLVLFLMASACGSDDDGGSSGSGGASGTGGTAGASGTAGSGGGTGGTGGTAGSGGTAGTGGAGGTSGGSGMGGGAGAAGASGAAGAGGNTTALNVVLYDLVSQNVMEGFEVCVLDAQPANCEKTDLQGLAVLNVPPDEDVLVTYGGGSSGYRPHVIAVGKKVFTSAGGQVITAAVLDSIAGYVLGVFGETDDAAKGHVLGLVPLTPGAVAALDPMSGAGPFYVDSAGNPDPSLTETSEAGAYMFANVDPGTVEASVTMTGASCTHQVGQEGSAPNATPAPVKAGWFTIVSAFECN